LKISVKCSIQLTIIKQNGGQIKIRGGSGLNDDEIFGQQETLFRQWFGKLQYFFR